MAQHKQQKTDEGKQFARAVVLRKLASKRVPKAVKAIQLVGNLAAYGPSANQTQAIVNALSTALVSVKERLSGAVKTEAQFSLPE